MGMIFLRFLKIIFILKTMRNKETLRIILISEFFCYEK